MKRQFGYSEKILSNVGLVEILFKQFREYLEVRGLIFNEGQLVDASFTVTPQQRNTREENTKIKNGEGDDIWQDKPNKKRHKDTDARWTEKNDGKYFGYKNHAKVDMKSKFINYYVVTDSSVQD